MAVASCIWNSPCFGGTSPSPRQGLCCVVHNDDIYLFGGSTLHQDGDVIYFNDFYKLKVKKGKGKWTEVAQSGDIPTARDGHNMCCVGDKLYLYGGKDDLYANECLQGLHMFDIASGRWDLIDNSGIVCPHTLSHSFSQIDTVLYAFGGIHFSKASNTTFSFDTVSRKWSPLKTTGSVPTPRCDHAAAVISHQLYIFGGCAGENTWLSDLYSLDALSLAWTRLQVGGTPPQSRALHTFTAHRGKDIYVFGGEGSDGETMLDDVVKFSVSQKKWKQAVYSGVVAPARQAHAAVVLHSTLYIIGGVGSTGILGDVHTLTLINPAERKPALKEVMQSQGVPGKSLEFQATRTPALSYDATVPAYSKPQEKPIPKTASQVKARDFSKIRSRASKSIEDGIRALEQEYYMLDIAKKDLEEEKAVLKQREEAYQQMYNKQQRDFELQLAKHQAVTESWLRSRQRENDAERKEIAQTRQQVTTELHDLQVEKQKMADREKELFSILKQFQHV